MSDLAPETLAAWRRDADDVSNDTVWEDTLCDRILALLDALAAEKARADRLIVEAGAAGYRRGAEQAEAERDEWREKAALHEHGYCERSIEHNQRLSWRLANAEAALSRVRSALDDELQNLADDGARLSHSVVRRIEAALVAKHRDRA